VIRFWPRKSVHVFTIMDFQWGQYFVLWTEQSDNDRARSPRSISSWWTMEQRIDRIKSSQLVYLIDTNTYIAVTLKHASADHAMISSWLLRSHCHFLTVDMWYRLDQSDSKHTFSYLILPNSSTPFSRGFNSTIGNCTNYRNARFYHITK
jgi:hypothetical protein